MTIDKAVRRAIQRYFAKLEDVEAVGIYDLVLGEAQKAMLETVMLHADGNQSKTARWLGISRGTLRKLLLEYK